MLKSAKSGFSERAGRFRWIRPPAAETARLGASLALLFALGWIFIGWAGSGGLSAVSPAAAFCLVAGVPIALGVVVVVTVLRPEMLAAALIFCCIFFNETIEHVYLRAGFFRLYPQDILLLGAIFVALVRVRSARPVRWPPSPLGKLIVLAIVYATFQAIRGIALGNEFNAAFGDLRRGYFYMIVYFLVLAEGSDERRLGVLHGAFVLGAVAIVLRGLYRLVGGRFFQMSWFDVFHVLGHSDLVFVIFAAYYCLARLIFPAEGRSRWPWAFLLPVALVLIALGNFRASWIGFALAGMVGAALLPAPKRRVLVVAALPLLLAVGVGLYASRSVRIGQFGETVQEEMLDKFKHLLEYENDPNIIWRMHAYRSALRIWSEHPVAGAGLGRRLVFHSINASGQQTVHFNHRAHNSLLWVGFTTGAVGVVLFLALHATYFFGAVRRLKRAGEGAEAGVILAYICFYVAFMTTALFDVIMEESATAITLYAHMAIVGRLGERAAARRET